MKQMGKYLNPSTVLSLYKSETNKPYFVDKTEMLNDLIPLVEQGNNHICITRPRRFGKSIMAYMIGSFFGKGADASETFAGLKIASSEKYAKHLNRHNLIYIDFSKMPQNCKSYDQYIERITTMLKRDLIKAYPDAGIDMGDEVWDALEAVFNEYNGENFIFVFDEWDAIFHKNFITEEDKENYTGFLAGLTKGTAYVSMTYMTGILPIAKYSSSSTINNFDEYNMENTAVFSEYFGFTNAEVDELYERYLANTPEPAISRTDLKEWYDGYHTKGKESIYNPRSVVSALSRNEIGSYWTNTGKYSELSGYIAKDVDGVRSAVILLIAGESVESDVAEYAATSMHLSTADEILSAMVVYGFLNYDDGCVRIPNRELQEEFEKTVRKEPKYDLCVDWKKSLPESCRQPWVAIRILLNGCFPLYMIQNHRFCHIATKQNCREVSNWLISLQEISTIYRGKIRRELGTLIIFFIHMTEWMMVLLLN